MKFLRLVEILLPAMLLTACTATPEECDPTRDPGFFNKIGCTFSGSYSERVEQKKVAVEQLRQEQKVSDRQFAEREVRFPVNTPVTKEAYLYREIFEDLFKLPSAVKTVPYGKSVACSTETAIAWDEKFAKMKDLSDRLQLLVEDGNH